VALPPRPAGKRLVHRALFPSHEETLTTRQAAGIETLMDLADNDLLDLLLARKDPQGEVDVPEVHEVLALMRRPPAPKN
jgi:antitoxin CptB